ncbi:MAG TPA: PAS domain-containing protein, partial [Lysobacter sp.]
MAGAGPLFDTSTGMGRLMAAHDWARTPLGVPDGWPVALRIAVRGLLASREPRSISWGPSLCLLYNDAYAAMMDARHPGALARPLPQVWPEVWDTIRADVESALAGRATFRNSVPLARLEGGVLAHRWHTVAYSPLFDDAGAIGGVQCLSLNVTEQVSTDLLRQRELRSMRELFAAAPGFMAVVRGPDYIYELANTAYEALVGRRDLIGRSAREVLPELGEQGYFELLDRVRVDGRAFNGRAMPVRLALPGEAPSEHFVDFVFQPIRDSESGAVERIFVQGADVTEREKGARALLEEAAGKDHFLAVLGHELRNPLAPIASAAALLAAGCDTARARQLGDVVQRQATQLDRIIGDLLDVARASRGSFRLDLQPLDLA